MIDGLCSLSINSLVQAKAVGTIKITLDASFRCLHELFLVYDYVRYLLVRCNHGIELLEVLIHNLLEVVEVHTLGICQLIVGHDECREATIILDDERLANHI